MSMVEFGNDFDFDRDNEYDLLQNLLDFPMECLEEDEDAENWDLINPELLGPIPSNLLIEPPLIPHHKLYRRPPNLFPPPVAIASSINGSDSHSPVSVLESKSLSLKSNHTIRVRNRSKRARYVGVNPWLLAANDISTSNRCCVFDKKCSHCQSTNTPQWRFGPLGPNTLCNACGVRYRCGRLFPEYPPLVSPMFSQSHHSNFHRKVIEMRHKFKSPNIEATIEEPPLSLEIEAKIVEKLTSRPEFVQITRAPKGKQLPKHVDTSRSLFPTQKSGARKQIWLAKHIESSSSFLRKKSLYIKSSKSKPEKASIASIGEERAKESFHSNSLIKTCAHCESTKTPQWREGPLGPRTLCNACGVRYRSGRLHPEYRPLSSPTFEQSKHSNLHKEVIQMIKTEVRTTPELELVT